MRRIARIAAIAALTAGVALTSGCVSSSEATWSTVHAIQPTVFIAYVAACAVAVLLAAVTVRAGWRGWPATVAVASLGAALAFPLATLLATALLPYPSTTLAALGPPLTLTLLAMACVAAADRVSWSLAAVSVLGLATAAAVCAEQIAGGALSGLTLFGYDVSAGLRLYGLGNELAAFMVAGLVAGSAGALAAADAESGRWTSAFRAWGFPLAAAVCLLVAAAPALGANIGVVLWGGVACASWWWLQRGGRIGWREASVAGGALAITVVALVAVDVASGEPTHLGAAWLALTGGRAGEVLALVEGRFATSWRILTYSPVALAPVVLAVALVWTRLRPGRIAAALWGRQPVLRAAVDATLLAVPVALLVEDSGMVVPAIMMLFVSAVVLAAALQDTKETRT